MHSKAQEGSQASRCTDHLLEVEAHLKEVQDHLEEVAAHQEEEVHPLCNSSSSSHPSSQQADKPAQEH